MYTRCQLGGTVFFEYGFQGQGIDQGMKRDRASMILLLMGETERGDVSAGKKLFAAVYAERTVLPSASLSGVVGVQRNDGHFERRAALFHPRIR